MTAPTEMVTTRAERRRDRTRAARALVAHRIRAVGALGFWVAIGSVLAAAAVAWTIAAATMWAYAALAGVGAGEYIASAAAYLAIAALAAAVPVGVTAGRAWRYHRTERAAGRERWEESEPLVDVILAEMREHRTENAKPPKPPLPRPVGTPIELRDGAR